MKGERPMDPPPARDGETLDGPEEFSIVKADEPLLVYVPAP